MQGEKTANLRKSVLHNSPRAESTQLWVCERAWRKGGGGCGFRGRAPVWDTCCMECWERTKQMGALCCCVGDCRQAPCYTPRLPHTHTHSSLVSRHKSVGPSCVTKMKQAQTTLSEPSVLLPLPAGDTDTKSVRELPDVVKHTLQCTGSGHPDYLSWV